MITGLIEDLVNTMHDYGLSPEQMSHYVLCSGKQIRRWIIGESKPSLMSQNSIKDGIKKVKRELIAKEK